MSGQELQCGLITSTCTSADSAETRRRLGIKKPECMQKTKFVPENKNTTPLIFRHPRHQSFRRHHPHSARRKEAAPQLLNARGDPNSLWFYFSQ